MIALLGLLFHLICGAAFKVPVTQAETGQWHPWQPRVVWEDWLPSACTRSKWPLLAIASTHCDFVIHWQPAAAHQPVQQYTFFPEGCWPCSWPVWLRPYCAKTMLLKRAFEPSTFFHLSSSGLWEPVPAVTGWLGGCTLDTSPICHKSTCRYWYSISVMTKTCVIYFWNTELVYHLSM